MLKYVNQSEEIKVSVKEFIVCGDPGCDGYNGAVVAIYENILKQQTDLTFVVGDMVPNGHPFYYKQFEDITNTSSKNPVYCVVGNHDIKNYNQYLGEKDYYIKTENVLFIILDNSKRYFCEETITFLKNTLEEHCDGPTFIFFHIPPPNDFVDNGIVDEQWDNIRILMEGYESFIKCIFTGHVHKGFDFELDGLRVIITGGAGANPDTIDGKLHDHEHHYYKISETNKQWMIKRINIPYKDLDIKTTNKNLFDGFAREASDYMLYQLYAEQAELEGYSGVAKLFKALSHSEMVHAKNMLIVDGKVSDTITNLNVFHENKKQQSSEDYPRYMKLEQNTEIRSGYVAFDSALMAEKMHVKLLQGAIEALSNKTDYHREQYYVCGRCGYVHTGDKPIKSCPACGTSKYFFSLF